MTTVIYRRQSLDKSGDELGIDRQLKECQRVAKVRGLKVDRVITDNSITASKRGRPGYAELIQLMASGQVDTVLILRIDRLLRLNDELEELIQLVERNPVHVITVEGDVDLGTPQGRLVARILVSVARSEVEVKGARHKLANRQKAQAGKPHGARRAFGYESDGVTVREDEAAVLRDLASKFLSGWSYKELAYWLNEQGIRTSQGKLFYPITIRNMLQRKRYAGIREYEGEDYAAIWSPIFDVDLWTRLQFAIKTRVELAGDRPAAVKYLLTGLLVCGKCGSYLNGETKRDHPGRPLRRTYNCRVQGDTQRQGGCGGVTRNADALEHFIREAICFRLDTPDLAGLLSQDKEAEGKLRELLDQRASIIGRRDSLVDDYADGTLDKAAYTRARSRLDAQLRAVDDELDVLRRRRLNLSLDPGETVREAWTTRPDGWRRQVMTLLIKRVVVHPGITKPFYDCDGKRMRFDPSLVDIDWAV